MSFLRRPGTPRKGRASNQPVQFDPLANKDRPVGHTLTKIFVTVQQKFPASAILKNPARAVQMVWVREQMVASSSMFSHSGRQGVKTRKKPLLSPELLVKELVIPAAPVATFVHPLVTEVSALVYWRSTLPSQVTTTLVPIA